MLSIILFGRVNTRAPYFFATEAVLSVEELSITIISSAHATDFRQSGSIVSSLYAEIATEMVNLSDCFIYLLFQRIRYPFIRIDEQHPVTTRFRQPKIPL